VLGFANTDRAVQFSTGMGAASTVVHFAANLVIKALIKKMAAMARPPSRTFYERSLFTLLSIAWCINTVALPFVVGIIPFGLTQAFYEAGGVIQHVCLLAVIGVFATELGRVFPIGPLFQRYVLAPSVRSQRLADLLWHPPRMWLGIRYAELVKAMAISLFYAPLYPPLYVITAAHMIVAGIGFRHNISFWLERPPHVDQHIMTRLLMLLQILLLLHIFVTALGERLARTGDDPSADFLTADEIAPFLSSLGLWIVALVLRKTVASAGWSAAAVLDTQGIRYSDLPQLKGCTVERYACPGRVAGPGNMPSESETRIYETEGDGPSESAAQICADAEPVWGLGLGSTA